MKILRTLLALSSLSLLAGCACDSGIKIDNSWINGDYTGDRLSNLLVVGLAPNEANVKIWEDAFVAQLQKSGRRGTPAHTIFNQAFIAESGVDNEEAAKAKIRELGFDGVILLGCKYGDDYQCHFIKGSELASVREKNVREKLQQMAMDVERVELHQIQIDEYDKLPGIFQNFAELIDEIGYNPFKGM